MKMDFVTFINEMMGDPSLENLSTQDKFYIARDEWTKKHKVIVNGEEYTADYTSFVKQMLIQLKGLHPSMDHKTRFRMAAEQWRTVPTGSRYANLKFEDTIWADVEMT